MSRDYPLAIVGVLIVAPDGEILLTESYKWAGVYSIPGGKIDMGESAEACAHREVREEVGLTLESVHFALYQESIFSSQFFKPSHFVALNFIGKLAPSCSKESVVLNEEHQNFLWISPKEALKLPLNDLTKTLILFYDAHTTAPTAP